MVKISSSVHTRLENGMYIRKEVLETALRATQALQLIKEYKKENTDKKKLLTKFQAEISNLKETVHELEFKDLPQEATKELMPKKPEIPVVKQSIKKIEQEIKEEIEKPLIKSELELEVDSLKRQIENIKI